MEKYTLDRGKSSDGQTCFTNVLDPHLTMTGSPSINPHNWIAAIGTTTLSLPTMFSSSVKIHNDLYQFTKTLHYNQRIKQNKKRV